MALNGVQVQSVTQPIEDDGLTGSLAITIQAAFDQHHSTTTAIKVRSGLRASAREGFFVGGRVPFGYRLEAAEKRGNKIKNKLAIDEDEALIVRLIYRQYQEGLGHASIVTKLNADGVRNRAGKPWYKSSIGQMLTCSTYAGRHLFKPTDWRTKKPLPRAEWIEIPCPAIIPETEFENTQRIIEERNPRRTPPRTTSSDVLLAKVAKCGSCGGSLQLATGTGQNGTVYAYYKCSAKILTGLCPGGEPTTIPREVLDDLVIQTVANDLFTPQRISEIVSRAALLHIEARDDASRRISSLRALLQGAKRKEANLWDLAADQGVKMRDGFLAKIDALQEEGAALQRQIIAHEQLLGSTIRELSSEEAAQKGEEMRACLLSADIRRKRRFIEAVVQQVSVNGKEGKIEITGAKSTLAETANGIDIRTGPPVRGFDREWCCR